MMRRYLLVLCAAACMLLSCNVIPCGKDADCPPQTHCRLKNLEERGFCAQDCVPLVPCGGGGRCDSRGRCVQPMELVEITITEPREGAELAAGGTTDVAGFVRFGDSPVFLKLTGMDALGCTPVLPQSMELPPPERSGDVPFRFTHVPVGEAGGTLTVQAAQLGSTVEQTRTYHSGRVCEGCPSVNLTAPAPAITLKPHAMGVLVSGRVEGTTVAPLLVSRDASGRVLSVPLALSGAEFTGRVVPVSPGENDVGVEVEGTVGKRTCVRRVSVPAVSVPFSAHLSWEGEKADLDLAVVPPDTVLGPEACRAESRVEECLFPTNEQAAPGPEAALLSSLRDGAYGVVVLTAPGNEGPVRAVVTALVDGAVLFRAGPRMLDPRRGEAWLVARVEFRSGLPRLDLLDRVVSTFPMQPPDAW